MQLKQLSHTSFLPQNPYTVHNTSSHILKKGDVITSVNAVHNTSSHILKKGDVITSVNAVLNKKHQTKRDLSYSFFLGGGGVLNLAIVLLLYFSALI